MRQITSNFLLIPVMSCLVFKRLHPATHSRTRTQTPTPPPKKKKKLNARLCSCSWRGQEEFDGQTARVSQRDALVNPASFSAGLRRGARKQALMPSAAAPLRWHLTSSDFIIPTGKLLVTVFVYLSLLKHHFRCVLPTKRSVSVSGTFLTYNYWRRTAYNELGLNENQSQSKTKSSEV